MDDPAATSDPEAAGHARVVALSGAGSLFALAAYGMWGFAPIYWKQLDFVPATEILAYRILGSLALAAVGVVVMRQLGALRADLASTHQRWLLVGSGLLLGSNWWIFIYAVNTDRIVDTSLGYYLTPLVNVALGMALFGERLTRAQGIAVGLAAVGVANLAWDLGRLPWISLALGGTFAIYGALRKSGRVSSIGGFLVESAVLALPALGLLLWLHRGGDGSTVRLSELPTGVALLIAGCGVVTAAPLLCFASAAKRLPLTALGLFQYIAPSLSLIIAVWLYGEPFTPVHGVTFALIWAALALFVWDSARSAPLSVARPSR